MCFVYFSEQPEMLCFYNFDQLNRLKQKWRVLCLLRHTTLLLEKGERIDLLDH